jgi:hypothetical protein
MGKAGRGGCSTLWESVCGKRMGDDAMRRGAFIFIRIDCIDDDASACDSHFSSDPNTSERIWMTADLSVTEDLVAPPWVHLSCTTDIAEISIPSEIQHRLPTLVPSQ